MSWFSDIYDNVNDVFSAPIDIAKKGVNAFTSIFDGGGDSGNSEASGDSSGEEGGIEGVDYNAMYEAMANMYAKVSALNEDKFNKYWPQSINKGIAASQVYDDYNQTAARKAQSFNLTQADQMNNWLAGTASAYNNYMRSEAGKSNEWIKGQVADVNEFNSDEFYKALNTAMPGIMDTAGNYKSSVDSMLSGELPDSVKNEISMASAERGFSSGVYGSAQNNAQLRDLGISRLQYVQAGQAQIPNLIGVTQALTAPVATPNIYQNVMATPTMYTPSGSYATPTNAAGISSNYLSAIMGSTLMQPSNAVSSAVNMAQIQNQTNIANTELQYANKWSQMNYDQQQSFFDQQMSAQKEQRWWDLGGSILGAGASLATAGIMGSTKKGSAGSMFGNWY